MPRYSVSDDKEKYIRTCVTLPPKLLKAAKKRAEIETAGYLSPLVVRALENHLRAATEKK